jgi:hypothetical protein
MRKLNLFEENTRLYSSHQACEPGPEHVIFLRINQENSVNNAHKRVEDTGREYHQEQAFLTSGQPDTPKHSYRYHNKESIGRDIGYKTSIRMNFNGTEIISMSILETLMMPTAFPR